MNEASGLPLNINPQSPIPINVQLKEQLLCLIGSGVLKQGDFLPSANELADRVSLNRNTVNAIYNQLAKDGIVSVRKGSGTQVLGAGLAAEYRELLSFVQKKIKAAADLQLNLQELPVSLLVFSPVYEAICEKSSRILFVTFRADDFDSYMDEIKSVKATSITPMAIEQLMRLDRAALDRLFQAIDILVTPYAGLREIQKLDIPSTMRIIAVGDIPY